MNFQGWCTCVLVFAGLSPAQVLTVSSVSLARGEQGTIEIGLTSTAGNGPLALQWEMEIPAQFIVASALPQPGTAARAAGKSITCSGKWKKAPKSYSYTCIAAGGKEPIGDGAVALIPITVPSNASGSATVRVTEVHTVSPAVKKSPLKKTEGVIAVR